MHYALHQDKNIFSIQLKGQLLLFMLLFPWETQGTVNTLLTRLAQMRQWYHAWAGSSASCTLSVKWKTLIGIRTLSISKRHSHLFSGSALVPSPRGYLFSSPWLRFVLTHPCLPSQQHPFIHFIACKALKNKGSQFTRGSQTGRPGKTIRYHLIQLFTRRCREDPCIHRAHILMGDGGRFRWYML